MVSLIAPAQSQTKVKLQEVASGLIHPLAMVSIPDGTGRMAVIEQTGQVRIIDNRGRLLPEPFLDVGAKMVTQHHFFDERGLLGIAFHPSYKDNGKFYVAYSVPLRGTDLERRLWWSHTNIVSEFQASKADPNKADANNSSGSFRRSIGRSSITTATGSGSGQTACSMFPLATAATPTIGASVTMSLTGNGQDLNSIHGKMLRIDVNKPDWSRGGQSVRRPQ